MLNLFQKLTLLFETYPEIDELGYLISSPFIETEDCLNTYTQDQLNPSFLRSLPESAWSPFVLQQSSKLGLSFQIIPTLFEQALNQLLESKQSLQQSKDPNIDQQQKRRLLDSSKIVVLINAEHNTAWNTRKLLLSQSHCPLNYLEEEIKLLNLVFTKHPKSGEAWGHRKWVVDKYFKALTKSDLNRAIENELSMCIKLGDAYASNYYCWSYRHWLVDFISENKEKLNQEFETIKLWNSAHIGDHAGWHHRQLLLSHHFMQSLSKDFHAPLIQKGVKNETKNKQTSLHTDAADKIKNCSICELFSQEIAANTSTILIHPTQTALYYHRRFLISHYSTLFQHHLLASENTVDTQTKHTETEKYYNLTTETDFIASIKTDFLSEEEQQKVNVNTQSYTKWLKENAC